MESLEQHLARHGPMTPEAAVRYLEELVHQGPTLAAGSAGHDAAAVGAFAAVARACLGDAPPPRIAAVLARDHASPLALVAALRRAAAPRRTRAWLIAGAVVVAAVAAGWLVRAHVARRAAEERGRQRDALAEKGRQLVLAGDPLRGLPALVEALRLGADGPATRFLVARGLATLAAGQATVAHGAAARAVALSPDAMRVASGDDRGTVIFWDAASGARLAMAAAHDAAIAQLALAPDGRTVASLAADGRARLWDGTTLVTLAHDDVAAIAFAADGALVATAGRDGTARVWRRAGAAPVATLAHGAPLAGVALTPGRAIAWGQGGRITVWRLPAGALQRELLVPDGATPRAARLAGDGKRLLVAAGRHVHVFDVERGARTATLDQPVDVVDLAAAGPYLATAAVDGTLRVWTLDGSAVPATLAGSTAALHGLAFCDASRLVTAGADGVARLWDAARAQPAGELVGHSGAIAAVACRGGRAVTASLDATARSWDLAATRGAAARPVAGGVVSFDATPDGRLAVIAGRAGHVLAGDPRSEAPLASVEAAPATMVRVARDGARLLVAGGTTLELRALPDGSLVRRADVGATIAAVDLSADGRRTVVAGENGAALWELGSGALTPLAPGPVAVARFSPDGRRVLAGAGVWDATTGAALATFAAPADAAAWDPAGERVVLGGRDRRLRVFAASGGAARLTLDGRSGFVAVTFDARGELVVGAGEDGALRVWEATGGALLLDARPHAGRVTGVAAVAPDGLITAGAEDSTLLWWDLARDGRRVDAIAAAVQSALKR